MRIQTGMGKQGRVNTTVTQKFLGSLVREYPKRKKVLAKLKLIHYFRNRKIDLSQSIPDNEQNWSIRSLIVSMLYPGSEYDNCLDGNFYIARFTDHNVGFNNRQRIVHYYVINEKRFDKGNYSVLNLNDGDVKKNAEKIRQLERYFN